MIMGINVDQPMILSNFSPTFRYSVPSFFMIHSLELCDFNVMARSAFKSFLSS